jgi:hypothetical protein
VAVGLTGFSTLLYQVRQQHMPTGKAVSAFFDLIGYVVRYFRHFPCFIFKG